MIRLQQDIRPWHTFSALQKSAFFQSAPSHAPVNKRPRVDSSGGLRKDYPSLKSGTNRRTHPNQVRGKRKGEGRNGSDEPMPRRCMSSNANAEQHDEAVPFSNPGRHKSLSKTAQSSWRKNLLRGQNRRAATDFSTRTHANFPASRTRHTSCRAARGPRPGPTWR